MMRCDSCPKKLFVKLVLSGLPSGWTCGICLVRSLSLLFNLFDDGCIMNEGAMLCWDKFLHLLPKRMVLFFFQESDTWLQSVMPLAMVNFHFVLGKYRINCRGRYEFSARSCT
jgi:hypothetical protein